MSDLISRSELISRIESEYREYGEDYDVEQILGDIEDMPTVYDIDKVVNELEEVKMRYFLTIANTGDEKSDFAYENVGNALDKVTEIVKQGGVSDDVCEWEYVAAYPYYKVGCKENRVPIQYGDYCPYCGNKIKVVK